MQMSVEQLKLLIDLLCRERILWAKHKGEYDVSEAVMAIKTFHAVCHAIDAADTHSYMQQLREQVKAHQYNLSDKRPGAASRGSWGSCLSGVEHLLNGGKSFQHLKWRLRRDSLLIKIGAFGIAGNWRLWLVSSFLITLAWLAIV
ncbi:hypothetical protein [Thalassomonas viridans]|nr:hypothetical protein [Thalassomonas viridans]